jgi:hypothetical protein
VSPHSHSPHPPKRATGDVPAPPPMPMHSKHVAIGKHRRRISATPTPHTAHQVPFCTQNAGRTTPSPRQHPTPPHQPHQVTTTTHAHAHNTYGYQKTWAECRQAHTTASHTPTCGPCGLPHRACVRQLTHMQSPPCQACHRHRASPTTHAHAH